MGSRDRFTVRSYQPGDEGKITDMFNEVFSQQRDISHWYWKYRDNPRGSYCISLAVSEDGMLAAHYGGYPVKLRRYTSGGTGVEEITTFHLGDKMTRKKYRAVGFGNSSLLAQTFTHFRKTFAGDAIPFGYGFGTHHSLKFGLLFLNYADIEPICYRRLPADQLHRLGIARMQKLFMRRGVREVFVIDDSWTDFFGRVAPAYRYLVVRDEKYLRWRYLQRPDRKYTFIALYRGSRLDGWSVFFRESNKLIWGDALFKEGDIEGVKSILCYVRSLPLAARADFIESWFPQRPQWWDVILDKIGFTTEAEPRGLHLTGPVFNDPQAPETLRQHFYYTLGDSDLF